MDISSILKIGDLMELEYEHSYCSTKVNDVSGNRFIVDFITYKGRPVHLKIGERYEMLQKTTQGLFFFDVRYEERIKTSDNKFFMAFLALSEPVKKQRRQTFRIPIKTEAEVLFVSNIVNEAIVEATKVSGPRPQDLKKNWIQTFVKDISEDGQLIHMPTVFEVGAHIFIKYKLDDQWLFANAVVRRHTYNSITDTMPNMIGVQMLSLTEEQLRSLRRFLIKYQIKQRELERENERELEEREIERGLRARGTEREQTD